MSTASNHVSTADYLRVRALAAKLRQVLAMQAREIAKLKEATRDLEILKRVLSLLRKRLSEAEKSLHIHSDGKSEYFHDYPDAQMTQSQRGHLPILKERQADMVARILGEPQ